MSICAADELRYSYNDVFAAMCIMEEIASPVSDGGGTPWEPYREQVGTNQLREDIMQLVRPLTADWERAYAAYEADETGRLKDPGPFDYEFVPVWLRLKVDWTDLQYGPRVKGSAHAQA